MYLVLRSGLGLRQSFLIFTVLRPQEPGLSPPEWISVLKLSSLWMIDRIREKAIQVLKQHYAKDAIHSLQLSLEYDIKDWMMASLTKLIVREEPIGTSDVEVVGIECALKICQLRERGIIDMVKGTTYYTVQRRPFDYSYTIRSLFPECASA